MENKPDITLNSYYFDAHCHIADPKFDVDRDEMIDRFLHAGVRRALVVADPCDEAPDWKGVRALVAARDFLYLAVGVHPHNAKDYTPDIEAQITKAQKDPKCRLWGEIGLDYHYDFSPREVQRDVFARQLECAYACEKPVQLHIREAHGDCMDILRAHRGQLRGGIMHCYTGSWEAAKVYLDLGLYISLSGAVTFKNAPKLWEVAKNVPGDRLLIETDCPYMAPVPMRGRRNEPAFLPYTFEKVRELRGTDRESLARQLWKNACAALGVDV